LKNLNNLLGVGPHVFLIGLFLEGLTLMVRRWISFPIPLSLETRILLTIPCVVACLGGMIWFNRSLNLIEANRSNGEKELITHGPFSYVRHPLYATLLMTIPPLFIVWFADLLFFIPWILTLIISHYIVVIEEQRLAQIFGQEYETYRRYVPALLPYKGNGGQRYRKLWDGSPLSKNTDQERTDG